MWVGFLVQESRILALRLYYSIRRLSGRFSEGRNVESEEISNLEIYRSNNQSPWVQAHREYAKRYISKRFRPFLNSVRDSQKLTLEDLTAIVS